MRFLYVGRVGLPNDAPGVRIQNLARILQSEGHEVVFCCERIQTISLVISSKFSYYFFRECHTSNRLMWLIRAVLMFCGIYTLRKVSVLRKRYHFDAIILYNDHCFLTVMLLVLRHWWKIKVYADVTEWYEFKHTGSVWERMIPWLVNIRIRFFDYRLNGVIAISTYLENYYRSRRANVIQIPPIFPDTEFKNDFLTRSNLIPLLCYAGFAGNKDILLPILQAVAELNRQQQVVSLKIIGMSADDIEKKYHFPIENTGIEALGVLPRIEVQFHLKDADYSFLLRHKKRYAQAGYSTKFAECMSLGIPLICNRVGGAESLIQSGKNGYLVDSPTREEVRKVLEIIVKQGVMQRCSIQMNAWNTARNNFSFSAHKKNMIDFICKK